MFCKTSINAPISILALSTKGDNPPADDAPMPVEPVVPIPAGDPDGLTEGEGLAEGDPEGVADATGAGLASDFLPMSDWAAAETASPPCFSLATQETYFP